MTRTRLLVVLLSAALGCLLVAPLADLGADPPGPVARPAPDSRTAPLRVLREWDRARAAAWRRGDPDALASLYTAGSATGRADRALLAAYVDRGLRVVGMRMQVASVEVEAATDERIHLLVTDRLVGASAVGRKVRTGLPRDSWSRRRVVLVRVGEGWRVVDVRDQPRSASTASASRSANS